MMYDRLEFFSSYFARASEKQLLVDALGTRFGNFGHSLSLLDLGSHDGGLLHRICERYQDRFPANTSITAVDPSPAAVSELLKRKFGATIQLNGHVASAESWFARQQIHYDWIIASQCLYWSDNLPDIVSKIYHYSNSALIVLRGKKGIYQIQSRFRQYLGNKQEQLYTAEDIELALRSQQIPYERVNHCTDIELPDSSDPAFNWLIGFILQIDDLDEDAGFLKEVRDYILMLSRNGKLEHEVAHFWLAPSQDRQYDFISQRFQTVR